jgi:hypothetical protein
MIMVLLIVYWGYLALFFFLAGFFVSRLIVFRRNTDISKNLNAGYFIFVGIAATTVLMMGASFFIRIHDETHFAAAVGLLVYTILERKPIMDRVKKSLHHWRSDLVQFSKPRRMVAVSVFALAAIVLVGFVAAFSNGDPSIYDTGLYHAQMVKWIQEYSAVPGLANIHGRFGFNNSWFVTAAFVDVGPFVGKSYHVVTGFIYLVILETVLWRLFGLACRRITLPNLFCLPMFFLLMQFLGPEGEHAANSLSTDIPSSFFILMSVLYFLDVIESESLDNRTLGFGTLLVSFAVTIKLLAAPLLLLPIVLLGKQVIVERSLTKTIVWSLLTVGLTAGVVLVPWLCRGIVTSGYLLYPSTVFDVFHMDWKVPKELAVNEMRSVMAWARVAGEAPSQVLDHGFLNWLPRWTDRNDWHMWLTGVIIINYILSSVIFLQRLTPLIIKHWGLYLTFGCGLVYWFASAPDTRFAWGYFVSIECLITASVCFIFIGRIPSVSQDKYSAAIVFCCLLVSCAPAIRPSLLGMRDILRNEPLSSYPAPVNRSEIVYPSGTKLFVCDEMCYDAALPTIPRFDPRDSYGNLREKKYFIAMRGNMVQEGFRFTDGTNHR